MMYHICLQSLVLGLLQLHCYVRGQNFDSKDIKSVVRRMPGHYPSSLCVISFVGLNATGAEFGYIGSQSLVEEQCSRSTLGVWPIRGVQDITVDHITMDPNYKCHEIFEIGLVFTVFYWHGTSNYFHLHYDMTLPLFKFMDEYTKKVDPSSVILMPSVESSRLERINWDTPAFDDESKYWYQLIKLVAGGRPIKPLNRALLDKKRNYCFKTVYFGTLQHKNLAEGPSNYIKKYVNYIWKQLNIKPVRVFTGHKIGIISRKNRRRILNEEELVETIKPLAPVKLLTFEKMTVKEQITEMQQYTVLVGVNGAGLMNGLYLPPHAAAVQLVPHNASVNWHEFGKILEGRGPYLVYHNEYTERSIVKPYDKYVNNPDTNFHPGEFKELMEKAMSLVELAARGYKDEL